MENIILNTWIEINAGTKVRLIPKNICNSDEKYALIMEINENGKARSMSLIVKGRKVFDSSGKCVDFGDAYPLTTEHGNKAIYKSLARIAVQQSSIAKFDINNTKKLLKGIK